MVDFAAGIHDFDADVYHADPAPQPSLSSSVARTLINQSPLHAWTQSPRLNPHWEPLERKTFDIGRAAHRAVLGRGGDYVAIPEDLLASNGAASTKAAKEFIEESRTFGRTPLKADEKDRIDLMAQIARQRFLEIGMVIDPDRSEQTALAQIDKVWCRAMVDNAPRKPFGHFGLVLVDFKTCEDASPMACRRSVENYGYDVQAEHYMQTWKAATGEDRSFIFAFQEKSAPYEVSFVSLYRQKDHSEDWGADAAGKIALARDLWGECLNSGDWPGYPAGVQVIGAQSYHRRKWEEAEPIAKAAKVTKEAIARARAWQAPEAAE